MTITKRISFLALAAVLFVGCKDTSKDGTIEETPGSDTVTDSTMVKETASLETASFNIEGMSCSIGCASVIEKKLAGLEGVQEAKVDFENKTATVSFDAAKQSPEKLVETVEGIADGAYKVSDVKSSGYKAYYDGGQEQEKKKKKKSKKEKKAEKAGCETEAGKKSCCAGEGKKSCSGEAKGGSL